MKATLYGWHLSYFTGKVLCYLRYKQVPFDHQAVNLLTLAWRIKRRTGELVMPVFVTAEGEWLQDSSHIIDRMEAAYPARPVIPSTPVQRFLAYLLEAWGDEWWVPVAMHTRWTYSENYALFEREAGANLLPNSPAFVQRLAAAKVANGLRSYLPAVGVRPEQFELLDAWTVDMLDLLERHFEQQQFLFGASPSLGDFGLVGTMYGHLGRDPWPARELVGPRPHLRAWIDRMALPQSLPGVWHDGDQLASTLLPVLRKICSEFLPLVEGINQQVRALLPQWPSGKVLPRRLADVEVRLGDGVFRRAALPYTLWMMQRALDCYRAMTLDEQEKLREFLATVGGLSWLTLELPRLQRRGLRVFCE